MSKITDKLDAIMNDILDATEELSDKKAVRVYDRLLDRLLLLIERINKGE